MFSQIILEIVNLKWYVIIYVLVAVLFCGIIYFTTRDFDWSFRKIRAFSILYNLNTNGRIAISLLLGRLIFVFCLVIFGGSFGLWDLLVLTIFSILIPICSRNLKDLLQIFTYTAIYIITLMENMFIGFYYEVESSIFTFIIAILFGIFAFLYSCYQTLTSFNNLLEKSALTDKKKFDKGFYENEVNGANTI